MGNVTDDGVRTYEAYTPFNLPTRIRRGGTTLEYTYDGDHQRATERVVGTGTTTFVNGTWFEFATSEAGAVTAWRHYLDSPEGVIGVVTRYPAQAATTRYWHKDHLGSVVVETDANGGNPLRLAYDAWGKRRLAMTQLPGDPSDLASASSQRGFTGHEHLDEVGIVHMNGRLYNPVTGHFLQADPIIQEPLEAQSYNRYGYVLNNPLSYTDPSGFSFWKTWGRPLLAIVAAAFMQLYLMPAVLGSTFGLACTANGGVVLSAAGNAISSIGSGFAAGGIAGGNLESALQGAVGASLFFAAGSIAQVAATTSEAAASAFAEGMPGRVALHATVGCGSNAAAGGSCKHGAASAGFAQIAGPYIHTDRVAYNVAASAVAGGVGAVLGGGKFQNGAVTGAFGYLFNHCSHVQGGCWRALKDAASMTYDWATGRGPDTRVFGPGSIQVVDMMDAPGVNDARAFFYGKNAAAIASGSYSSLQPVTNYGASFDLGDLFTTSSPTQQFVGSYRVDIWPTNGGSDLTFVVNNNSSFKSFGYGIAPAWERSAFAPAGNIRQTYWWTERRYP